jgi:acetyl esterase/lipase
VRVVAGPGLVADPDLLRETTDAACAALGVAGRVTAAADPEEFGHALAAAGRNGATALVALPGPDPAARRLMRAPGRHAARTVWCDLTDTGPVEVATGGAHLYGRGMPGLVWAIRHAVHRLRRPARRIRYGGHSDQWGELRLPPATRCRRPPVAVLLHGGYWRSAWGADLMDALAVDLAARGVATWNLEYRRPDRHGWSATTADVADGLAALATVGGPIDLNRTAAIGHSAGGQLALRAVADSGRVALAVSLAGLLDLAEGERRGLSDGAVAAALGGSRARLPEVYTAADPLTRLPLRVPQLIVQGRQDDPDLVDCARRYVTAARAAGDPVVYIEQQGGHFAPINPAAGIWRATAAELVRRLAVDPPRGTGPDDPVTR